MPNRQEHRPDSARLKELLFGRKIVDVSMEPIKGDDDRFYDYPQGSITLDDGTVIGLAGNTGGCSCGAGDYDLTVLNTIDNAITNVIVEERPGDDDRCEECDKYSCDHRGWYKIFVVAEDQTQHLVAQFDGSDGNGYYGTGYWIAVLDTPVRP